MHLEVHQQMGVVTFAESFNYIIFVLPDPLDQFACDACVQSAIALAGKHVDGNAVRTFKVAHGVVLLLDSGFRRNDGRKAVFLQQGLHSQPHHAGTGA